MSLDCIPIALTISTFDPLNPTSSLSYPTSLITDLTTVSKSGFALEEISPAMTTKSVLTNVSQATLESGSSFKKASSMASEIWSASLSG